METLWISRWLWNLPINLREAFDSETLANFSPLQILRGRRGRLQNGFEDVLAEVGRQMDEKIVKERLEETISYNVSNEKEMVYKNYPAVYQEYGDERFIFLKSKEKHIP